MQEKILQEEALSHKLISKGLWAYAFAVLVSPLGYFLRLLASNTLSVSDVGIFYGVLGLMSLLSTYNDLGLTESMVYFLPKYRLENKRGQIKNVIGLSIFMQLVTGIIIFLLLFLNADWLAINHFHSPEASNVIKVMSLFFLGYNLIQVCSTIFTSFQDTFNTGLVNFSRLIATLIFSVIFRLSAGFSLDFFALSRIVGITVGILVGLMQLWRKYNYILKLPRDAIDKKIVATQFKYAFLVFLTANIGTLLGNVDQQLVVNKLGTESSGYFTNMISLLTIFSFIVGPISGLAFPVTTELSTRNEKDKFKKMESLMYTYLALLSIITGGYFLVFGQEISVLLYGEKFRFSGELLQILGPCLIFTCLSGLNFGLLAGLGKIKERFIVLLISLIVNVSCNMLVLFVLNLDLHAVITVLALSRIIQFIGGLIYLRKEYTFDFDRIFFLKNVLIIGILCLLFRWIKNNSELFYPNQNRRQLLFILAGICLIYVGIIAGFNRGKIKTLRNEVQKVRKSDS